MEFKDVMFLPIFLIFLVLFLNILKPIVTNERSAKYFFPAIILKLIGAAALGLIYQFYYGGGDTFNYYKESTIIYESFFDSPTIWGKLLFASGEYDLDTLEYTGRMYWYHAPREYMVIRFATFFGIFSANSYLLIAFWFTLISFLGMWALFVALLDYYPQYIKQIAISLFFIPSLFFWGSGLMKDTLCVGGLGWMFYGFYFGIVKGKRIILSILIVILSSFLIISIKPYIFYAFSSAAAFWVFNQHVTKIKSIFLRLSILVFIVSSIVLLLTRIVDLEEIAQTSKIQSEYIYNVSKNQSGSAYTIGEQDGTFQGMIKLFLPAVNVSLFRPYLYEVKNPVMLLSSIEATFFLIFTLYVFFKVGFRRFFKTMFKNPLVNFCFVFSIIFSFFVGVSSYNFGALVRYKIPMMPFYLMGLYFIYKINIPGKKKKGEKRQYQI